MTEKLRSSEELFPVADSVLPFEGQPPPVRRIYCNRDLRLDQIELVGFDMDYTLAIYKQEQIDRLSIEATARKLVQRGYPNELLGMSYRANFPIRGLLVDKKLGNVLKTDRYRYAKKAFHGTRELSSDERKRHYQGRRIRPGTRRYYSIDTLYALSEVAVFTAVVDALDSDGRRLDYATLFDDVRAAIDEAHRDGTIKGQIAADLERYIERDPDLPETLHKLRSSGKGLFLLTNSEPEYTDLMMRFLLEEGRRDYPSWRNYFDVIITHAAKPAFFTGQSRLQEVDLGSAAGADAPEIVRGRMYRAGNLPQFERLTGVRGDRVLYVGDHIYGDVLRAKKESSWRTLMIIQEMTSELSASERFAKEIRRLHALEGDRYALLDGLRDRQSALKQATRELEYAKQGGVDRGVLEANKQRLRRTVERARSQLRAIEQEYAELEGRLEASYHPFWGSPFKAESELSSFGEQVERYACLYADRVTNLLHYSANHYFRGPRHRMAHEVL